MKKSISVFLMIFLFAGMVYADRGSVPFIPGVKIYEPTQDAMIAWNGEEEILLLSTELKADRKVKVLEVIPFMSRPEVKEGDKYTFEKASRFLQRNLIFTSFMNFSRDQMNSRTRTAAKVVDHKQIGAHDISVIELLSSDGFFDWVDDYLKKQGSDTPGITSNLRKVIKEYIRDGFTYFVFDVIELNDSFKKVEPIQYRFRTDRLYYPIKISSTDTGETTMSLIILTHKLLTNFPEISFDRVKLVNKSADIGFNEVRDINKDMATLFEKYKKQQLKMRVWTIKGRLEEFTEDLIAY
ncbi:MAG: DUF2330 domain-containing protein [Candidatus Muiribacteriaceae bacterium]